MAGATQQEATGQDPTANGAGRQGHLGVALGLAALGLALALAATPARGAAQRSRAESERLIVLVVDPGPTRINQQRLTQAIGREVDCTIIRMTDERAPAASGRLTIAFSRPDRWVLRYEARGQVAWIADRIRRPRELRSRLAQLSEAVVERVDDTPGAQRRRAWEDDLVLALQSEIVDPFADDPPRPPREPITVLWSEVVDPFADGPPRAEMNLVWNEVLDPWAQQPRPRDRSGWP